jgi:hypothetical protein
LDERFMNISASRSGHTAFTIHKVPLDAYWGHSRMLFWCSESKRISE